MSSRSRAFLPSIRTEVRGQNFEWMCPGIYLVGVLSLDSFLQSVEEMKQWRIRLGLQAADTTHLQVLIISSVVQ